MNQKHILNGAAALLAVGCVYTFSSLIVQQAKDVNISSEFTYQETETEAVPPIEPENITELTITDVEENNTESPAISRFSTLNNKINKNLVIPDTTKPEIPEEDNTEYDNDDVVYDEISDDDYTENDDLSMYMNDDDYLEEEDTNSYSESETKILNVNGHEQDVEEAFSLTPVYDEDEEEEKEEEYVETADDIAQEGYNYFDTYATGEQINSVYFTPEYTEPEDNDDIVSSGCGETFSVKVHGEVQEYDAYQLVCMIVANEMSSSFNKEALKAQAICAYSYLKYHEYNDITASVLTKTNIPDEVADAVSSVWGQCCYYNGAPAQTVYTASTSGYTASASNVWGGSEIPYLTSQACPFDITEDPNYGVKTTYTEDEVRAKLESYTGVTLSGNPAEWLKITEYEDGNYVKTINVDNQCTISGSDMREDVMSYALKSASFDIEYSDGIFTFTTYGYGHGCGLSQNGANILANQGYSYVDIMNFYFPGTYIS